MTDFRLSETARNCLTAFVRALVCQERAHVVVPPEQNASGYWFGGGNMTVDTDGSLLLIGRYRSGGDSRTGLEAGTRGCELAVFRSTNQGQSFDKVASWDKQTVAPPGRTVISIEGSCLRCDRNGCTLYVSSEKDESYPETLAGYQKPGAGVWSIDVLRTAELRSGSGTWCPLLSETRPGMLHVKDPFFWEDSGSRQDGLQMLGFCSHPYCWTSSSSGRAVLSADGCRVEDVQHEILPRGSMWDVAMTRATCVLPVPSVGEFALRPYTIVFYCGGECVRKLEEHSRSVSRPRGYSCEEIGGVFVYVDGDVRTAVRLSDVEPLFVSPWGTGCSRYVDVLAVEDEFLATWQQSRPDRSQPLVLNRLPREEALSLLADPDAG